MFAALRQRSTTIWSLLALGTAAARAALYRRNVEIRYAMQAGATWRQVANATGLTIDQARAELEEWSKGPVAQSAGNFQPIALPDLCSIPPTQHELDLWSGRLRVRRPGATWHRPASRIGSLHCDGTAQAGRTVLARAGWNRTEPLPQRRERARERPDALIRKRPRRIWPASDAGWRGCRQCPARSLTGDSAQLICGRADLLAVLGPGPVVVKQQVHHLSDGQIRDPLARTPRVRPGEVHRPDLEGDRDQDPRHGQHDAVDTRSPPG